MPYGFVFRKGPDFYVTVQDEDLYFSEPSLMRELSQTFADLSENTCYLVDVDVVEGAEENLYRIEAVDHFVLSESVQTCIDQMGNNQLFTRCMMCALMGMVKEGDDTEDTDEEDSLSA